VTEPSDSEALAVLVVDDDEQILKMLWHLLNGLPYDILTAPSSEDALRIIKEREIALLISDLNMGDAPDGNAILQAARDVNPNTISILMSGNLNSQAMITALNQGGIWKCLKKPLAVDEVLALIKKGVAQYASNQAPRARLEAMAKKVTVILKDETNLHTPILRTEVPTVIQRDVLAAENAAVGDRYELCSVLGDGGTGTVYEARDTLLDIQVGVKVLKPRLSENADAIRTLKEEARIAMELSHINIVRLYNLERNGDTYFLIMEHVSGCSLRDVLVRDRQLSLASVTYIGRICCAALGFAHEQGVVHRDLKPENIMITDDGVIKIIDFGIACLINAEREADVVAGTPVYMSPEQKHGGDVDSRTDIYAMGIILGELLTGELPYPKEATHEEILEMHPAPLTGLPPILIDVLETATAQSREARYVTIREFAEVFAQAATAKLP
jgi:DNA-binding response OmpR family regulator/tRNA A-37 threonylcarbamoyl transferase component Bud32